MKLWKGHSKDISTIKKKGIRKELHVLGGIHTIQSRYFEEVVSFYQTSEC